MARILVLYDSRDKSYADALIQSLRARDDQAEFDARDNVSAFTLDAPSLENYSDVLVLASPQALDSPGIRRLLDGFAGHNDRRVIVVIVRAVALPEHLRALLSVDAQHLSPQQLAGMIFGDTLREEATLPPPQQTPPVEDEWVAGVISPPAPAAEPPASPPQPGGLPVGQPAPQQPPAPAPGYAPPNDIYASTPPAAPYYDYGQPYAEPPAPPTASGGGVGSARGLPLPSRRERPAATERPQFTAYHPNETPVAAPQTLVVYMHLAAQRSQVQADAGTFTELGSAPTTAQGQALRQVPHNVEITVEPHMEGVTFSPPQDSFIWRGEWHRSLFRFTGAEQLAGTKQRGWIDVYADRVSPICTLDVEFSFHASIPTASLSVPRGMAVTSNAFDTVFISYSHRDREPMRQARETYQKLGVTTYHDDLLRAGDNYERELAKMIRAANIFHLLWSDDAARSAEVRNEWTLALSSQKGERFIRPWYWQQPIAPPPEELRALKLSFRYERLRRRLLNPSTWF